MKNQSVIFISLLALSLQIPAVWADSGQHAHEMQEEENTGSHHKKNSGHEHGHEISVAGQAGNPAKISRTIKLNALDTMRFDKTDIKVKPGETIRFVVGNVGKIKHEFTIGTREEQREHAQMMTSMPGMEHEEGNSVTIQPGETKELIWQFGKAGALEIACHLPGHFEAGMWSRVIVRK